MLIIAARTFYFDVAVAGAAAEVAVVVGLGFEAFAIRSKTRPSAITRTFRRCAFTMKADTFCCARAFCGLIS